MITICYSTFGIPLFLILLAESGLLLTRILKLSWVYIVRFGATSSGKRIYHSKLINVGEKTYFTFIFLNSSNNPLII
jgi:hypothetical protein